MKERWNKMEIDAIDKLIMFTRGGDLDKIALNASSQLSALKARVVQLEAEREWHEVGLIHDGTDLVITYNGREVDVGWYHPDSKNWHLINGQPVRSKITHWMPLPEPPKEE